MCYTHASVLQAANFAFIQVNTVGCDHLGFQHTELADIWHHRQAVFFAQVFNLVFGFRHMEVNSGVIFFRQLHDRSQDIRCTGINRMRRNCRNDQGMILPLFNQIFGQRE